MAEVFVGVGSSINRLENVDLGLAALQKEFGELKVSPLYESEAVGFAGGNFYNLVVRLETNLDVHALIKVLKEIEIRQGREKNAIKFAPRTLDLDLLLYDLLVDETIDLPRAEILKNAFVLKPLAELAPQLLHPVVDQTYQALWESYPQEKQKLWKIEYPKPFR